MCGLSDVLTLHLRHLYLPHELDGAEPISFWQTGQSAGSGLVVPTMIAYGGGVEEKSLERVLFFEVNACPCGKKARPADSVDISPGGH